jgi:hypothetical protein
MSKSWMPYFNIMIIKAIPLPLAYMIYWKKYYICFMAKKRLNVHKDVKFG